MDLFSNIKVMRKITFIEIDKVRNEGFIKKQLQRGYKEQKLFEIYLEYRINKIDDRFFSRLCYRF